MKDDPAQWAAVEGSLYECRQSTLIRESKSSRGRSVEIETADVITVVWVEPEAEAPAPWIRDAVILTTNGPARVSLGALERSIRKGEIVLSAETER